MSPCVVNIEIYLCLQMLLMQTELELEKNELTVPKLLYYLQPTIWVMEEIWNTVSELPLVHSKQITQTHRDL